MNFKHLEYAVTVARYGSISKAAQTLLLSQPYLSSMIKNLEEELGYQVFKRTSSGILLTENGQQFVQRATCILRELKAIQELSWNESQPLRIASYYATYIMDMFLQFRSLCPQSLPDKISEMGNEEVLNAVMAGNYTLGILFCANEKKTVYEKKALSKGLKSHPLFSPITVYAVMSASHPLTQKQTLSIMDLAGYPYVSYEDSSSQRYLSHLGIGNHPRLLEVSDRGSFYDALRSGGYLSVMAYRAPTPRDGLVLIPLEEGKFTIVSVYVTTQEYHLTPREQQFLSFLKKGGK